MLRSFARRVITSYSIHYTKLYETEALVDEGLAREVVNRVQRLRKEAGYEYRTRIELGVVGDAGVVEATRRHRAFVEGETLTRRTMLGASIDEADVKQDVDIEGSYNFV